MVIDIGNAVLGFEESDMVLTM